ncbi:MAG TPA: hypothetical protein VFE33_17415 [Thermoanaerobaculia bacterium]|nr:hypothetical protein [Thermoanaerobaculia bacterium]
MKLFSALLLSLLILPILPAYAQSTTHTAETANNTSACSGVGLPDAHCQGPFGPMVSTQSESGTYEPKPGHVSPLSIHQLLYPGSTTKIFATFQPWFTVCHPGAPSYPVPTMGWTDTGWTSEKNRYQKCNNHVETGYNSNDQQSVDDQIADMVSRGFDGVEVNWYGAPRGTCPGAGACTEDGTTQKVRSSLDSRCAGNPTCAVQFTLQIAHGSITSTCGSNATDSSQPACVLNKLDNDLDYANANYFASSAYLKVSSRPVVAYFIEESKTAGSIFDQCTPTSACSVASTTCTGIADCWTKVWSAVRSHANGLSHGSPLFLFRNTGSNGGFTHTQTNGAFSWDSSTPGLPICPDTNPDPNRRSDDKIGLCYLDNFYSQSLSYASLQGWGGGWQGFEDAASGWGQNRHRPQECGNTWLLTMAEESHDPGTGPYYSSSRQLPFFHVATWNDYDEGTAIEPGIDNCWGVVASVSGSTLSWSLAVRSDVDQPNAATYASENTIDHYAIYDSSDGENLTLVGTSPRGSRSIALTSLPLGCGTRTLYVEAVGMPSILDQMSAPVSYTTPPCGVTISSPVAGSTASPFHLLANEGTSRTPDSMVAYLDGQTIDTEFKTDVIDRNVSAALGSHLLAVKAWYSDGTSAQDQVTFSVSSAAAVTLSSPVAGTTVSTPLHVLANENTSRSAISMQVFLDGTAGPTLANSDSLDTQVEVTPGSHTLDVKATYSDGTSSTATATFSVRDGSVAITSPAVGVTGSSPVHVVANESSSRNATTMKVYLDDVAVYTIASSDTVDTQVSAAAGAHTVTVKAWYSDGTFSARSVAFTVQ